MLIVENKLLILILGIICYFRARMDLQMIPLYIDLRALLRIEMCFCFLKCKCFEKTLINCLLWQSQSRTITKPIFNYNDAEPDNSVPDFGMYTEEVSTLRQLLQNDVSCSKKWSCISSWLCSIRTRCVFVDPK